MASVRPALALAVVLASACSSGGGAVERRGAEAPAVPVGVAAAVRKDAPVDVRAIGTVEPYATVALKPQIDGQLAEIFFAEGQEVKQGDPLFRLDTRPFEAALRQAEANLAKSRVQAEHARVEARRFERLAKESVASREEYDRTQMEARAFEATVTADEAALARARIDLEYCSIASRIDGRIGRILVHQGNVVKANETTLAIINQLRPIYVSFSVPQQDLPEIRKRQADGRLPVAAANRDGDAASVAGELVFVNNTVDQATGTVLLKALFTNPNEELWPGQFVDVALELSVGHDAIVIPARAVQTGQQGKYVFVVKEDGAVELRPVVVGQSLDQEVVVAEGVAPGEHVVTEGQLRLAPGVRVAVKEPGA